MKGLRPLSEPSAYIYLRVDGVVGARDADKMKGSGARAACIEMWR